MAKIINLDELSREQEMEIVEEIRERFPDVGWPNCSVERLQVMGFEEIGALEDYLANVIWRHDHETGEDIPEVIGVRSPKYRFVRYEVLTKMFEQALEGYERWGAGKWKLAPIDGGKKFMCRVVFPGADKKLAKVGDLIAPLAQFKSSLDLEWPYQVEGGGERLACTNGMTAPRIDQRIRRKHRTSLDVSAELEKVHPTLDAFDEQMADWNRWAETAVEATRINDILEKSPFGNRYTEQILALPETVTGETIDQWINRGSTTVMNLYNVFTQFITHELESDVVRVQRSKEVAELFQREFRKAA